MTVMTPEEQAKSAELDGAEIREVSPEWYAPFQPWVTNDTVIDWWAWCRATDAVTPVYRRTHA